jgi:hypothetical protein
VALACASYVPTDSVRIGGMHCDKPAVISQLESLADRDVSGHVYSYGREAKCLRSFAILLPTVCRKIRSQRLVTLPLSAYHRQLAASEWYP